MIGAGLQATRRLPAMSTDPQVELRIIIDTNADRARLLAQTYHCAWGTDWRQVIPDTKIDIVVVLTYPDTHAAITRAALRAGKDVLCEKPLTRTEKEAQELLALAKKTRRILKCGFNHRHHPAIAEAHRLFTQGIIGRPLFGRGCYGIGGRPGVEKEWRSNPQIVSGGQLMEQGIHLIDLFRWFVGDFSAVTGMVSAGLWPIAPLEDNAFAIMKNESGVMVSIHASLTQWINLFRFEIYGHKGSLTVEGLGQSYGVEKLRVSLHHPLKPFSHQTIEFRGADQSWQAEWREFMKAVQRRRQPLGNGYDGWKAMQVVNAIYKSSQTGRTIVVK